MINIHGQGYYGALAAGAQSVMVSFNSWTNEELGINEGKLHGSQQGDHGDPQGQDRLRRPRRLGLERHRPGRGLHERELPAGHQRRHRHRDGAQRLEGVHRQHRRAGQRGRDPDVADRRRGDAHPAREAAHRADGPAEAVRAPLRAATPTRCRRPSWRARRFASRSCCSRTRTACFRFRAARRCWSWARAPTRCRTRPAAGA